MRRQRRGHAVVFALTLAPLIGFTALSVDVGLQKVQAEEVSTIVSSAALAGSNQLDGTMDGTDRAVRAAMEMIHYSTNSAKVKIGPSDVLFGVVEDGVFREVAVNSRTVKEVNAVRVDKRDVTTRANLAPVVVNNVEMNVGAMHTAVASSSGPSTAGAVDCFLPIAVPSCAVDFSSGRMPDPMRVQFGNPGGTKNISWAHPTKANANNIKKAILNTCAYGEVAVDDKIHLNQGVQSSNLSRTADVLNGWRGDSEPWPYEFFPDGPPWRYEPNAFHWWDSRIYFWRWGQTLQGPIAIVDAGGKPGTCKGMKKLKGKMKVEGFTWGFIYDVRTWGGSKNKGFMIQLDPVNPHEVGSRGGGSTGNVTSSGGSGGGAGVLVD